MGFTDCSDGTHQKLRDAGRELPEVMAEAADRLRDLEKYIGNLHSIILAADPTAEFVGAETALRRIIAKANGKRDE